MSDTKVVKKPSEEPEVSRSSAVSGPRSVFSPMMRFGDLFGIDPFALMREFAKEMDRTFPVFPEFLPGVDAWAPALEIKESKGNLIVTAELPGISQEDVKVEVINQTLTIEGERKQEKKEEKEGYYRSERSYGRFYRPIPLPETAKTDLIKAQMNNGVLEIMVPLAETKKTAREVPIDAPEKEPATVAA